MQDSKEITNIQNLKIKLSQNSEETTRIQNSKFFLFQQMIIHSPTL